MLKKFSKIANPIEWFDCIKSFIGDKEIITIQNNLKVNYLKINNSKLSKFVPNKDDFDKRLEDLKDLFKNKEVNNDDLQKIVKYYLYILENRTELNEYKLCKINDLLNNFKKIIGITFNFFEIKKQNDAINFISFCYNQILELFNIIKIKVYEHNSFKNIDKNKIIDKIQDITKSIKKKIV